MAKYGGLDPNLPGLIRYGVAFWVTPTDHQQPVDVERAPDSGGSPDTGAAVTVLSQRLFARRGGLFLDQLPGDNAFRHYRFRHAFPGATVGAWSSWVKARPDVLDEDYESTYPLRRDEPMTDGGHALRASDTAGKDAFDDLYIGVAKSVRFGTAATPGEKTRTVRIPHSAFKPVNDSKVFEIAGAYIHNRTGGADCVVSCALDVPAGAVLTAFRSRTWKNSAPDTIDFILNRVESEAVTQLAQHIPTGTGAWQTATSVIAETASAGRHYMVFGTLTSSINDGARVAWVEYDYEYADYDTKGR